MKMLEHTGFFQNGIVGTFFSKYIIMLRKLNVVKVSGREKKMYTVQCFIDWISEDMSAFV